MSAFSFHETKNVTSGGEGGVLTINDPDLVEPANIVRDKGIDRAKFLEGVVEKYSWVDLGGSFTMNEISAAWLSAQRQIQATFHYVPRHSSPAGLRFGRFDGTDEHTTSCAESLVRLPRYHNMSEDQQCAVIHSVLDAFR